METPTRTPQAPAAPLPELDEFLRPCHAQFARSEARHARERSLTGLLTEQPIQNCDTIAQVVPATSEQQLQGLLTAMDWDEDDLNRQRVQPMRQLPSEGDGVLVFDDTGFAQQGKCPVGVARQYSGTPGKTGNGPVTVNCHYAERTPAWPIATRLYLPQDWAADDGRRKEAKVPRDVSFQTKPAIALALLDQAREWGVPHVWVTADADYGDNPNSLAGLEQRRERYVVGVRCDFEVALDRRGGSASRADTLVKAQAATAWRVIRWREGSQGWLQARCGAVRGWRVQRDGTRRAGWLIGEGSSDGKRRYSWSNLGPKAVLAKMVGYAHRRHWVEQFHEEAKGLLGWDQDQGRLWPGSHRHAVSVMRAYSFLVWREWTQRRGPRGRGRPRRPFSPSAGPPASATARDPSPDLRLAWA